MTASPLMQQSIAPLPQHHTGGDTKSSGLAQAIAWTVLLALTSLPRLGWGLTSDVVSGWEWIVVGIAFVVDVLFWLWLRRRSAND